MKYYSLILLVLLFITNCQQKKNSQTEIEQVEKAVQNFFMAISEFDYKSIKDMSSDDLQLIEYGVQLNTDSLINMMKFLEDKANIVYKCKNFNTKIVGSVGWTSYINEAIYTDVSDGKETKIRWLESAVLEKIVSKWKLAHLHSTDLKSKNR